MMKGATNEEVLHQGLDAATEVKMRSIITPRILDGTMTEKVGHIECIVTSNQDAVIQYSCHQHAFHTQ